MNFSISFTVIHCHKLEVIVDAVKDMTLCEMPNSFSGKLVNFFSISEEVDCKGVKFSLHIHLLETATSLL